MSLPAETVAQREYLDENGRCLLCDYVRRDTPPASALFLRTTHFMALVPWWAVWPFEVLLVSKAARSARCRSSLPTSATRLADALKRLTTRYDNLFETSFPYTMGFHQPPTDGRGAPGVAFSRALLSAVAAVRHGAEIHGWL